MKNFMILILCPMLLVACHKNVLNNDSDNQRTGGQNNNQPVASPTPGGGNSNATCNDNNATNQGLNLPCVCQTSYLLSQDGLACILNPQIITGITISAASSSVGAGNILPLDVSVSNVDGEMINVDATDIVWQLSPGLGVVLDNVINAVTPGTLNLTASIGNVTSNVLSIDVTGSVAENQTPSRVEIRPTLGVFESSGEYQMRDDQTRIFSAITYNSENQLILSPITWSSSNSSVATVSSGLVTALSAGSATITASSGGVSETINIEVTDSSLELINLNSSLGLDLYTNPQDGPQSVALTGVLYDLGLSPLLGVVVNYQSLDPDKVSVSSSGVISVNSNVNQSTTAEVKASVNLLGLGLVSRTYKVYIYKEPRQINQLFVLNPLLNIDLGVLGLSSSIAALDQLNKVIANAQINYSSSNTSAATVNQNGHVLAVGIGTSIITGTTSNGQIGSYIVKVGVL